MRKPLLVSCYVSLKCVSKDKIYQSKANFPPFFKATEVVSNPLSKEQWPSLNTQEWSPPAPQTNPVPQKAATRHALIPLCFCLCLDDEENWVGTGDRKTLTSGDSSPPRGWSSPLTVKGSSPVTWRGKAKCKLLRHCPGKVFDTEKKFIAKRSLLKMGEAVEHLSHWAKMLLFFTVAVIVYLDSYDC